MQRPKITYIIADINKAVFFEQTALALKNKGFELSFILINSENGVLDKFLTTNDFVVKNITVKKITKSLPAIIKCSAYLKKINPEIIHSHLGSANTIGLLAGFLAGIKKRIYTRHSGLPLNTSVKEKLLDILHNKLATNIVAISQNIKEILIQQKVKEEKIILIHHGFDLDRMMQPNTNEVYRIKDTYNNKKQFPVIGVVARWLELKGIQYTIPAFKKILLQYPNAKLCLFNATETAAYSKQIKELLNTLPDENYIVVPFENNVYDLYQLFDIYIHVPINSSCEAFGQTYVESLAAGIPSIFTLSGIAREFIKNEENALVVNFETTEEIYQALIRLLNNDDLANKLIINGRKDVLQHFNMNIYIDKLLVLYNMDINNL